MKGIVLDEEHVLRAMEADLAGRFIPVRKKKDNTFYKDSQVKSGEEFLRIRELVYQNIREMAEDLTQGHIAPLPVRGKSGKDPCSYCEYRQLCGNADGPVFREICGEQKGEEEEP